MILKPVNLEVILRLKTGSGVCCLFYKALIIFFGEHRQRSFVINLEPRLVVIQLFQLPGHLAVQEVQGDVHGADPFAFGAAGASSRQVHGADDVPGGVAGRPGGGVHHLRFVAVAEALFAEAERADLTAGVAFDAFGELFFPVGPALGRSQRFQAGDFGGVFPVQFGGDRCLGRDEVAPGRQVGVAFGAFGGDGRLRSVLCSVEPWSQHAGTGDADQVEIFAFQLRFPHQSGQGFQVAPFDDDADLPFFGNLFFGLGQVDGQVVDAGRGEDQFLRIVRRR